MKNNKNSKKKTGSNKKNIASKGKVSNKKNVSVKKNTNTYKNNKKVVSKKSKKNKIISIILIVLLSLFIIGCICVFAFFAIIVKEAPDFDPKNLYTMESSIVYSSSGNEIAKLGVEKREKVSYDDLPQVLIDAIVATEDSAFFQHNGFNAARFLKASISQVLGSGGGGASTLTMQVSKNAYTSDVASGFEGIKRKFTDIYLSIFKIEKTYTKKEIMEFYVNSYYMGGGAYGVEQACLNYFGKSVSDINLAEAAMIAGIYQAPGTYDPTINPEATEERRKIVLNLMVRHGYITEEERDMAFQLTVDKILSNNKSDGSDEVDARYKDFIDTVVEDVKKKTGFDPYTTPMLIYTTMDEAKQEYVTNLMNGTNFNWENDKVQAGIAVIDNNNGSIVAVGAGRNRKGLKSFNYATMINNQIGSTSKPLYDYAPLIEYNDASTYRLYYDEPYSYSDGNYIKNWDGGYKGLITMREALRVSRNIPALKAFQENDRENIRNFVRNIGLSPEEELHEAHSIGSYNGESPLTVAAAYSTFANGGYYTEPYAFTKIIYRNSSEEYEHKPKTTKVMSEATAYMVADMLVTTSGWATGTSSVNGISFGSKTGTTNYDDKTMAENNLPGNAVNDLWVAGICRDYATAVWYGYDFISNEYYNKGNENTRLYSQLIKGVFTGTPSFTRPSGVVSVTVEKDSPGNGLLPSAGTPDNMKITELFKAGTEPTKVSTRFKDLSNVTNLNASLNGNKVVLSWDAIKVPDALNSDYLKSLYASTCRNVNGCVNSILNANKNILGDVVYDIYVKNSDGSLRKLNSTSDSKFDVVVQSGADYITYVVKTAYSKYGATTSSGVEVKVDISSIKPEEISALLIGNSSVTLSDTKIYKDQSVKVTEGNKDVSSTATIKSTITGSGKVQKNDDNSYTLEVGEYTITYDISYKSFKKTLTRKIVVK